MGRLHGRLSRSLGLSWPLWVALCGYGYGCGYGCVLQSPSFDGPASATASATASSTGSASSGDQTSTPTTTGGAPPTVTATTTTTTPNASNATGSTGEPTTTGESSSGGDQLYPVSSCAELLDHLGGEAASGTYTIRLPQNQDYVKVYCDMETAGGGWLLAGRSTAQGAENSFGWRSNTGDPANDDAPYSLGFNTSPFHFDELLIGTWSAGKSWGDVVYHYGVPSDLVINHTNAATPTTYYETVKGECKPPGGPTMLQKAGLTNRNNTFFFRDIDPDEVDYGLNHDGFSTFWSDNDDACLKGGLLDAEQGMIMVR